MRPASPLPAALRGGPLSAGLLRARGVTADHPGAWVSHTTTAHLLGLPVSRRFASALHLSVRHGASPVRRQNLIPHRARPLPGELRTVLDGLPAGGPERTFLECASLLRLDELICLGDALVRIPRRRYEDRSTPHSSLERIAAHLSLHPHVRGRSLAGEALQQVRIGADSVQETRMRLALVRAGLPEPELQVPADPQDPRSPEADAAYLPQKVALQYDGHTHFDQDARDGFRRTVTEVRRTLAAREAVPA